MASNSLDLVIQVLLGLGGAAGVTALLRIGAEKRKLKSETDKTGADAAQIISNSAVMLLEPARKEIAELQENLDEANAKIDHLVEYVEQLVNIIRDAGLTVPRMTPVPKKPKPASG